MLSRGLFERAASSRGRLRNLLLAALRNFRRDLHRRSAARPDALATPIDDAAPLDNDEVAQRDFDRSWATAILQETLRRCESHFTRARKDGHWFCFRARVVDPAARSTDPPEFAALAERFGFADAAAAVAAVQVVRRRFDMLLREVISETIASPDDLEDELRWFASVLRVG